MGLGLGIGYSVAVIVATLWATTAIAQAFDSGSTGADGAFNLTGTAPGTIEFNPVAFPHLDTDRDGVYHFTTVTIPEDVTVRFRADKVGNAIYWLATGPVDIDGILDLNGERGHRHDAGGLRFPAVPGPGGFSGGIGNRNSTNTLSTPGFGPGGGRPTQDWHGEPAGHATIGYSSYFVDDRNHLVYGNMFLLPLIGGSGGGGGGSGGGAGGGAIMISSSISIRVNGKIIANGGDGGEGHLQDPFTGGGGSGGAIRLVAQTISGAGELSAVGGVGYNAVGGNGRVRIEAIEKNFTGAVNGDYRAVTLLVKDKPLLFPSGAAPRIRVESVNGVPAPSSPRGNFNPVDIEINTPLTADVVLRGENIPLGTTVTLTVFNETEGASVIQSPTLIGTHDSSTVTVSVKFPAGFSRIFTHARWGQ